MLESLTPGAQRALERAEARARGRGSEAVEPVDLLAALLDEPESRAHALLLELGGEIGAIYRVLGVASADDASLPAGESIPHSPGLRVLLLDAASRARSIDRGRGVGTEHMLGGIASSPGPAADALAAAGLGIDSLLDRLETADRSEAASLPIDDVEPLNLTGAADAVDLGRILDASANRAQEGLRVVDDYVRFVLDDGLLVRRVKDVRHRLGQAIAAIDPDLRLAARDTRGDVGTHVMTSAESARENPAAVLSANLHRAAEALRSLEEYTKLVNVWLAGRFEVLRYDVYTLEKLVVTATRSRTKLEDARLYVLVGGLPTLGDLTWIVGEALAGGAQVIQLREKALSDREILTRARELRILTAQARATFIMNDRPDLARLAGADGVHLGQEDVRVRDARRVLGPAPLIGVSTHEPAQLEAAVLDGAGYLGVGPVFPGRTKRFESYAGLEYIRHAASTTTLPWFAIGGIELDNLDEVLAAGARRVAVGAAITRADRPRDAAKAFLERLDDA